MNDIERQARYYNIERMLERSDTRVNERTANERYESERVERVSATSEAFRPIRERLNVVKERYTCEHSVRTHTRI